MYVYEARVSEILQTVPVGSFRDVGQVCDKGQCGLLCLLLCQSQQHVISGNSVRSEPDCLQSVFVNVPDAEPILDASPTLHHAAPSKNKSSVFSSSRFSLSHQICL